MKRFLSILFLVSIIIIGSSFKFKHHGQAKAVRTDGYYVEVFKDDGDIMAIIDGKVFETREENKYVAELANKSADNMILDKNGKSKLTRVANALTFFGTEFTDEDNNTFKESLGFEYTFNDGQLGEQTEQRITLNYNNQKYYNLPNETKFKITKIEWSKDRRYFIMSADFDCKMRSWGVHAESSPTLRLKGKMEDINVTVPPWIVVKNPAQTADIK